MMKPKTIFLSNLEVSHKSRKLGDRGATRSSHSKKQRVAFKDNKKK
jgi:hypothetical protein